MQQVLDALEGALSAAAQAAEQADADMRRAADTAAQAQAHSDMRLEPGASGDLASADSRSLGCDLDYVVPGTKPVPSTTYLCCYYTVTTNDLNKFLRKRKDNINRRTDDCEF